MENSHRSVPLSGSAPASNGLFPGPCPILPPGSGEAVVNNPADTQPTDRQTCVGKLWSGGYKKGRYGFRQE